MWAPHEGMGWWMAFGAVSWVLLIAACTYLFSRVFEARGGGHEAPAPPESAAEIARRRYAAGDISEEEYDRVIHKLRL